MIIHGKGYGYQPDALGQCHRALAHFDRSISLGVTFHCLCLRTALYSFPHVVHIESPLSAEHRMHFLPCQLVAGAYLTIFSTLDFP